MLEPNQFDATMATRVHAIGKPARGLQSVLFEQPHRRR
jgi:hypothetical protein